MNYNKLIENIKNSGVNKILVTGPQRAGTRFTTKVLSNDLNLDYIDELDFKIDNLDLFLNMIKGKLSFVAQAPALAFYLNKIPLDVVIIFMYRNVNDIINSQKRISLNYDEPYKKIYSNIYKREIDREKINMKEPISQIKYSIWEKIQKPKIINDSFDLQYESLKSHPMWINKSKRTNFKPSQTK